MIVEMGFGFDDIEQVLEMSEFLSNYKELIEKFEPEISKFIVKRDFFKGPFLREYNKQFDQLVRSLIKRELMTHFTSWTPEDLLLLTDDVDVLKMLASELFDPESYRKQKLN